MGTWLVEPGSGDRVSEHVGKFIGNALEAVDPADAEAVIKSAVVDKLAEPEWGPPAGRILEQLIEEGRTEPIVQQLAEWLHRKAQSSHELIDSMVGERAPTWAPRFVNDMIGDRVHREIVEWTWMSGRPHHETHRRCGGHEEVGAICARTGDHGARGAEGGSAGSRRWWRRRARSGRRRRVAHQAAARSVAAATQIRGRRATATGSTRPGCA